MGDARRAWRLLSHLNGNSAGRIEVHEVLTRLTQSGGGRLQLMFTALLAHGQISGVARDPVDAADVRPDS
jgi:hypothetical protein